MRKQNIVLALSVLVITCIVTVTISVGVAKSKINETRESLTNEYEATIQQLSINYETKLQEIKKENQSLAKTGKEQKAELKSKEKELKEIKKDLEEVQERMDIIDGHINTMSSIIQKESSPKVSEELANEMAIYVWQLNNTYSDEYGYEFDPYLTLAFMKVESRFNPYAESYAEARGITQLTDRTGRAFAEELGYTTYNPFNWKQNLSVGWYYFNKNREEHGKYKAIVIYNQGYNNLSSAVSHSLSRPSSYLNCILSSEQDFKAYN